MEQQIQGFELTSAQSVIHHRKIRAIHETTQRLEVKHPTQQLFVVLYRVNHLYDYLIGHLQRRNGVRTFST